MIIYGALFIPLIVAFILYKYYCHKTVWWEFLIPITASLIFTFSMKSIIEVVQVRSNEYWGSFVNRVEYYEPWNEYIHRICTRSCGKNCVTVYDCSYVQYHPEYWQIITTTNEAVHISHAQYNQIKQKFGNEIFVELHRNSYTIDGDMYCSIWPQERVTATPVTTEHNYENRVKAADQSVFHFEEVEEADKIKYSIKEYPGIYENYKMHSVIGDSGYDALLADKQFCYINGLLGHKKEVRIFVLVFKNQPIEAALYQEWYWSGANMNEFVICIGIDNNRNVKWCKPISWTRCESLKVRIKDFVQSQKRLSLIALAKYSQEQIDKDFVRRDFKEFNYLTVEPPVWAVIGTYLLTIVINLGLSYWIIQNDYEE